MFADAGLDADIASRPSAQSRAPANHAAANPLRAALPADAVTTTEQNAAVMQSEANLHEALRPAVTGDSLIPLRRPNRLMTQPRSFSTTVIRLSTRL